MSPLELLLLLAGIGIAMLVAEVLLPTHGVLDVVGLIAIAGAIGVCFRMNEMLGMTVMNGTVIASLFVINLGRKMWERSPIGRKMILQPVDSTVLPAGVRIGQLGIAISELRPMGEVEFDGVRLEATSEIGFIEPGQSVRVVALAKGIPTVRSE